MKTQEFYFSEICINHVVYSMHNKLFRWRISGYIQPFLQPKRDTVPRKTLGFRDNLFLSVHSNYHMTWEVAIFEWSSMQEKYEMWVWSIGLEDALKEGMATPSGIFAWRNPWTEEPGWRRSIGLQKSDMTEVTKCACTEQERTLHQVQAAGQSTSHLGPRDPADQVCLKCHGGKTAFLALQQVPPIASQWRPLKLKKNKKKAYYPL